MLPAPDARSTPAPPAAARSRSAKLSPPARRPRATRSPWAPAAMSRIRSIPMVALRFRLHVGQGDGAHVVEHDAHPKPHPHLLDPAADQVGQQREPVVECDDHDRVGNREFRCLRAPDDGVAVHPAPTVADLPDEVVGPACAAGPGGVELRVPARLAALVAQFFGGAAVPKRLRHRRWLRQRDAGALWLQDRHGRSLPSSTTSVKSAPAPPLLHSATCASGIWRLRHCFCSWCTPRATRWVSCTTPPPWL